MKSEERRTLSYAEAIRYQEVAEALEDPLVSAVLDMGGTVLVMVEGALVIVRPPE